MIKPSNREQTCFSCIFQGTSACDRFHCIEVSYKQIRRVLKVIEMCEGIQANENETFVGKETAKVVAYEHIAEILKGVQNDTKGS